jgi:hypothetical protein
MNTTFRDLQDKHNELNGMSIRSEQELDRLLRSFTNRQAFFFELVGENGMTLLVGYGVDMGCAQHSRSDGEPPYVMAVNDECTEDEPFAEFLTGNTPTPIPLRFCLPIDRVQRIMQDFLAHGSRSKTVNWEEI